jgi:DNA-binding MarR family transcriptional regulator
MATSASALQSAAHSDDFLVAFDSFAQAVRRARGVTAQSTDGALTLSQYALLQSLADRPAARVRELAADAGITASTATRILDALERREIVCRTRSDEDRRGITITLTDSGRRLLDSQHEWMLERQRAFFEGLPVAERELVADLLARLAELIDELAAGPAGCAS